MSKRDFNSLYYADDKDIFDILSSKAMTVRKLLKIGRQRGLFLSSADDKQSIVAVLALLPFDWSQLQRLLSETETPDRKEKLTARQIVTDADATVVLKAVDDVKVSRGTKQAEIYTVSQAPDGKSAQIIVGYSDPDYNRTRLFQRRLRELVIDVQTSPDGFKFRYNANERGSEIVDEIIASLTPDKSKPVEQKVISLSGISAPRSRTQFFIDLMNKMSGFKLGNVVRMRTYKNHPNEMDNEDSDDEEGVENMLSGEEAQYVATVREIALRGDGLLQSKEYQSFAIDEFYIVHVIWNATETAAKKRMVEFEAEFNNARDASDFEYNVRAVYERDDTGELKKTKTAMNFVDAKSLNELLESAAIDAMDAAANPT